MPAARHFALTWHAQPAKRARAMRLHMAERAGGTPRRMETMAFLGAWRRKRMGTAGLGLRKCGHHGFGRIAVALQFVGVATSTHKKSGRLQQPSRLFSYLGLSDRYFTITFTPLTT